MIKKTFLAFSLLLLASSMMAQSNLSWSNRPEPANGSREYQHDQYRRGDYERPATPEQVDMVVRLIKDASFDDKKLKTAEVCLALRTMDTEAIRRIAECFSFEDNKLKFLKMAVPYCYDVERCYTLRDVLSFSSKKDDFMKYLDDYLRNNRDRGYRR